MFPSDQRRARITRAAFEHFQRHPRYARSQVDLRAASKALKERFPSTPEPDTQDAWDCAVAMLNIHGEAFLSMVDDMNHHSSFVIVLRHFASQSLEQCSGGYPGFLVHMAKPELTAQINELVEDWKTRGFERIAKLHETDESEVVDEESENIPVRRGYRAEVRAWMRHHDIHSVKDAAIRLCVGYDILKNVMSDQGDVRYSEGTLKDILAKITAPNGEW